MSAASRLPLANANAPAFENVSLRSDAVAATVLLGVPQLSLVATTRPLALSTSMVGSARAPPTPRAPSDGPAARTSNRRVPLPGETTRPGMRMLPPVPTCARAEMFGEPCGGGADFIHLDQGDAGGVVYPRHDRGVSTRREGRDHGRIARARAESKRSTAENVTSVTGVAPPTVVPQLSFSPIFVSPENNSIFGSASADDAEAGQRGSGRADEDGFVAAGTDVKAGEHRIATQADQSAGGQDWIRSAPER